MTDAITKKQARQFILAKQGLIGTYRFTGKQGAYDYVRQAGCIQYDPVDVCGKIAELTLLLQSGSMHTILCPFFTDINLSEGFMLFRIKKDPFSW